MSESQSYLLTSLLALVTLASVGHAQQQTETESQWAWQAPLVESSLLLGADSIGPQVIAVGERGHVLSSVDTGQTWQQGAVPTKRMLCAVDILDDRHAWAVGHDAIIVHSTDGGKSWSRQHYAPEDEAPLFDLWFENPRHGIAIGGYGLYLETIDGGLSWQRHYPTDEDIHFFAITESPSGTLYIAGELGTVLRSNDRGQSWQACAASYVGSFFGVLALKDDSVLVFGLRGNLYRSSDQGQSWQRIETATSAALLGGAQSPTGTVAIVGLSGCVLVSKDNAQTFEVINRPDRTSMATALALSPRQLLILGENCLLTWDWSSLAQLGTLTEEKRD